MMMKNATYLNKAVNDSNTFFPSGAAVLEFSCLQDSSFVPGSRVYVSFFFVTAGIRYPSAHDVAGVGNPVLGTMSRLEG
jgi:hypothetical protein